MPGRTTVRTEKTDRVKQLQANLLAHPMTALVGVRGVPANALQSMRRELVSRGHPILVVPNSALRHALQGAAKKSPSLAPLLDHLHDQTALLSAEGNPFTLYQELLRTRSPTPARGGETAPKDIVVPAQTTSFKPGPIVGELQHAGFPAAIEKGKVVLKKDVTIVRAGAPISREVAGLLTRLEIFPLEVGLELRAVVEGGTFFPPEVLHVDLEARRAEMVQAFRRALGLAVEVGYPTKESLPILVAKAHRAALATAIAAGYATKETIEPLLARAVRDALAVKGLQN